MTQTDTSEQLLHYSEEPITEIRREIRTQKADMKPRGFWVSVGEDWKRWCEGEDFSLNRLVVCSEVELSPEARVLRLRTATEIDRFTQEYKVSRYDIDWALVAARYQGIIIAPYCWERRMAEHTFWYYPWDCASGCIWDPGAISSVSVAPEACVAREVVREP